MLESLYVRLGTTVNLAKKERWLEYGEMYLYT